MTTYAAINKPSLATTRNGRPRRLRTLGQYMYACRYAWTAHADLYQLPDFLDDEILHVRNAHAHPTWVRFDPETNALVVTPDDGDEQRWSESDLKRVLASVTLRCRDMAVAIQHESGEIKRRYEGKPFI